MFDLKFDPQGRRLIISQPVGSDEELKKLIPAMRKRDMAFHVRYKKTATEVTFTIPTARFIIAADEFVARQKADV